MGEARWCPDRSRWIMDATTGLVAAMFASVVGNIIFNFFRDRNNGKVFEVLLRIKTMSDKQEAILNYLDALKTIAIKQTSLMEQLVKRDS
jgi:hypothetical protein